jgi:hypothetical protein
LPCISHDDASHHRRLGLHGRWALERDRAADRRFDFASVCRSLL